jgi:hypothetical protein
MWWFGALAIVLTTAHGVGAQSVQYLDGVWVAPKEATAPVELIAYAEALSTGMLRMQHGALEDAPLVHEISGAFVSLPNWEPVGAFVATEELFRDERAERRRLAFATQRRNVYAMAVRIVDLERRDKIDSLLKAVKASYETPGYAFIVISSAGHTKYFPIRLTPMER